jgi:hypothetical protein
MLSIQPFAVQKKKFNLSLPLALMAEFEKMVKTYGERKKWAAFAAAALLLLDLPEDTRRQIVGDLVAAEIGGSRLDKLITAAKDGRLRTAAESAAEALSDEFKKKPKGAA